MRRATNRNALCASSPRSRTAWHANSKTLSSFAETASATAATARAAFSSAEYGWISRLRPGPRRASGMSASAVQPFSSCIFAANTSAGWRATTVWLALAESTEPAGGAEEESVHRHGSTVTRSCLHLGSASRPSASNTTRGRATRAAWKMRVHIAPRFVLMHSTSAIVNAWQPASLTNASTSAKKRSSLTLRRCSSFGPRRNSGLITTRTTETLVYGPRRRSRSTDSTMAHMAALTPPWPSGRVARSRFSGGMEISAPPLPILLVRLSRASIACLSVLSLGLDASGVSSQSLTTGSKESCSAFGSSSPHLRMSITTMGLAGMAARSISMDASSRTALDSRSSFSAVVGKAVLAVDLRRLGDTTSGKG